MSDSDFDGPSVATTYPLTAAKLRQVTMTMANMDMPLDDELMVIVTHEQVTFKMRTGDRK